MKRPVLVSCALLLSLFLLVSGVFAWESERPAGYVGIDERTESSKTDGVASVGLGVHISDYIENSPTLGDFALLRISTTANTRKGITYGIGNTSYYWADVVGQTYYLPDDGGVTIYLPFKFRFYGGRGNAEYDTIWVSNNGFICPIDPNNPEYPTDPYYQSSVPSIAKPNMFIAPFWRDLDYGGSITVGEVQTPLYRRGIGITWNNVPDKYGQRQTFQAIIQEEYGFGVESGFRHYQSPIWFSYQSITLNDQTTIGIEDQGGWKGASYNYQSLHNQMTLIVGQTSQTGIFINQLTISFALLTPNSQVVIDETEEWMRGYNVILKSTQPDTSGQNAYRFLKALAGTGALLLMVLYPPATLAFGVGIMLRNSLFVLSWVDALAGSYSPAQPEVQQGQWVSAPADDEPVDAGLGILVFWMFNDSNNQDQSLRITANLDYITYDYYPDFQGHTLSTSADLKFTRDRSTSFGDALTISPGSYSRIWLDNDNWGYEDEEDYYKISVASGQTIYIELYVPYRSDFDLYLYSPSPERDQKASSTRHDPNRNITGIDESIYFQADSTGYWFIKMWAAAGNGGFYSFAVSVADPPPGGGGGGCPNLLVWNGSQFVNEGVLNISNPIDPLADVVVNYPLKTLPALEHGMYVFKLAEIAQGYNFSHSFIDYVKFFVVDGDGTWHESYLTQAEHSAQGNVMRELLFSDDLNIETVKGEEVTLKFHLPPIWTTTQTFMFQIEGHNPQKL